MPVNGVEFGILSQKGSKSARFYIEIRMRRSIRTGQAENAIHKSYIPPQKRGHILVCLEKGRSSTKRTHHKPALRDQKIIKPLHDALQNQPSEPMAWISRHDMNRGAIAQIVFERVLGCGKRHVAASGDLHVAIAILGISLIRCYGLSCGTGGGRRRGREGGLTSWPRRWYHALLLCRWRSRGGRTLLLRWEAFRGQCWYCWIGMNVREQSQWE